MDSANENSMHLSTLYISYNGMSEPLVRSQVLNYQEGLSAQGVKIRLLTFEKSPPEKSFETNTKIALAANNIDWHWLPYSGHMGGKGTLRDVKAGAKFIWRLRKEIDFVHCRSFIPALMAYGVSKLTGLRYLYDVRGFWAHEKRYKGRIKSDMQFKMLRWMEARIYNGASALVTLTDVAMKLLEKGYIGANSKVPRQVIPTCVNLKPFLKKRAPLDADAPLIVYSGSLGAGYMRNEVFRYFAVIRRLQPAARFLILSRSDADFVRDGAADAGLTDQDYELRCLAPSEMADALLECDVALSFILPDFSKLASCPTKMAEYLAAGLPVIANSGIGDVDSQLSDNDVGVIIDGFSDEQLEQSWEQTLRLLRDPKMIERGRDVAERLFSLDLGIARYASLYRDLETKSS